MATKKKESEGIALLSMYNDEEDEEMEEAYEEDREEEEQHLENFDNKVPLDSFMKETTTSPSSLLQSQNSLSIEDSNLKEDRVSTLTPKPDVSVSSSPPPPPPTQLLQSTTTTTFERRSLTIVDYGHDETAMSPEAEEGEIMRAGHVFFGEDIQNANGKFQGITPPGSVQILTPNIQRTPHPSEQSEFLQSENSTRMDVKMESETTVIEETVMVSVEIQKDVDPLDDFLPSPPKTMCSEELQEKINKFLMLKKAGKSFNAEVRNRKDYRNPDFLLHAVRYQDIDQIGSCFSKDVFDPHGYDKKADLKREMERKELERKRNPKVEFVTGATQLGGLAATQINSSQLPVVPTVASTGFHPHPTPADSVARESRQNKKSKWDKDDGDRKNTLHIGSRDAQSSALPHATHLSAANAGSGYTAFAQQKRREAEARKSSEKRRS
ncbi:hypothetical protein AQUCO_02100187v1 [Aquilegia coerulea]|uniref:SAP30-binding protein n=1 Tax=Aquilegia coerulea TaxID=218851 RepID=A0A2G5DF36_AQUCA|nr:hypothetical protein AQUCO_02100187v1 [Aquilegia coerulea]